MTARPLVSICVALALVATGGSGLVADRRQAASPASAPAPATAKDLVDRAFDAAYSLDHDEAVSLARQAIAAAPDDPDTHRALAAILWLNILFRRGAVTIDHYMGSLTKSIGTLPKPPPGLTDEFHKELNTSIQLAQTRLDKSPKDIDAKYDLGSAYALEASYSAAVDGSTFAAFKSAKKAYDLAEDVLDHQPNRSEAAIVVGSYRYLVATLNLPTRWFAYMAGFGGGKERGIALIESALHDQEAHMDAATALILIYSREGRFEDVLKLLAELEREYPRNRILVLEQGATNIRAGHYAQAESVLTAGLSQFDQDPRPKLPGERALWLYKRGAARVLLHHAADAQADLRAALEASPVEWVRGRIHLELGKTEDLQGHRQAALGEYRQAHQIADANNDPIGSSAAERYEHQPFDREKP
jgi:tetratricopeptide (TPR) repeat protein